MMRNQELQGYLIHYRKYREKSHIVHIFSQQYGRIDGIMRHSPPPQYQLLGLCATGKGELKNFNQIEMLNQPIFMQGEAFFAGFYVNELLLRLLPNEEAMPALYQQYQQCLTQLQQLSQLADTAVFLRQSLRQFEHILLQELGYALDFSVDASQHEILPLQHYQFHLQEGFVAVASVSRATVQGAQILSMQHYQTGQQFSSEQLQFLAKLYRQMLSSLLGDRPLKSRQLWIHQRQTLHK